MHIKKDVTDNINSETIISYNNFKIWKLVKENLKLYVFEYVFILWC